MSGDRVPERLPTPQLPAPDQLERALADLVTRAASAAGVTLRPVALADWTGWWATGRPELDLEYDALADVARALVYLPVVHRPIKRTGRPKRTRRRGRTTGPGPAAAASERTGERTGDHDADHGADRIGHRERVAA